MAYKPTIGLEIHAELKTNSKMFCGCKNDPDEKRPNYNICPVCTAQPGALPVANEDAIKKVIKTGLALNCKIAEDSKFDRKNYFYPDLPKGYQISQYDQPLCEGGFLEIDGHKIRITRIHLEEDTGSLNHPEGADYSLVNLNRAGVPLMELVTEPDITSGKEARKFGQELQMILKYLGVSDADMEKGQMRCDASVSLRRVGEDKLYPRVEIKNLNSFRSVENALEYQREKLRVEWLAGTYPTMASTVLWDDDRASTFPMRSKETAADYRYFPEPDIPVVELSEEAIGLLVKEIPPLRKDVFAKMLEDGMEMTKLVSILDTAELFWSFESHYRRLDSKLKRDTLLNFYMAEVSLLVKSTATIPFSTEEILLLVEKVEDKAMPISTAKRFLSSCVKQGDVARSITEFETLSRTTKMNLKDIVDNVLSDDSPLVDQYIAGEEKVFQALVGRVMRETKGMFGGEEVVAVIRERLETIN